MQERAIREITNNVMVETLAEEILDRQRTHPIVVFSTPVQAAANSIPESTLGYAEELWDSAKTFTEIVILPNGELTYYFETLMPEGWGVFGAAARSYPVNLLKDLDPDRSPLRFRGRKGRSSNNILFDAMRHAREAGLFEEQSSGSFLVSGKVAGHIAGGAIVTLESGAMATVWGELTVPDVPIEWIVAKGDRVTGMLDPETKRLTLELTDSSLENYLEKYPHNSVTLALVGEVTPDAARLTLRPGISKLIHTIDVSSNPLDSLDILLTPGDVVPVRIIHLSTGNLHLRLSDVDYDEPQVAPPALVVGGSPWLIEERTLITAEEQELIAEAEETSWGLDTSEISVIEISESTGAIFLEPEEELATGPIPGPGMHKVAVPQNTGEIQVLDQQPRRGALADTQLALQKEKAENQELRRRLKEVKADDSSISLLRAKMRVSHERWQKSEAENFKLRTQVSELKEQGTKGQQMLREARRIASQFSETRISDRSDIWPDSEQWIRHEIYLAWVERVPAAEKNQYPLPEYVVGENFTESVLVLTEDLFDKSMRTVVDALTDRAKDIPGRDLHTLRLGASGTEPDRTNDFGQRCMRAAVEQKAASARRLHYWQGAGAPIELSRVVAHDDMEP